MAVITAAGTSISIGTTAANAVTDTYVLVGEVTSIGEFGKTFAEITHMPLAERGVQKFKGSFNDGNISLSLAADPEDPGQQAMLEALDSDADYNFRIELNDEVTPSTGHGTYYTFKAKVMSYRRAVTGVDSLVQVTCDLGIQSGTITETAAT